MGLGLGIGLGFVLGLGLGVGLALGLGWVRHYMLRSESARIKPSFSRTIPKKKNKRRQKILENFQIPDTIIGVIGQARLTVTPSQSITDANRYSFTLQPNIPLELYPRNSFLRVRYRVKKKDGSNFVDKDQVMSSF